MRIYSYKYGKPCPHCGAGPSNIVTYDMPLKNDKKMRVTRCTNCDNLIRAGKDRERVRKRPDNYGRKRVAAGSNNTL